MKVIKQQRALRFIFKSSTNFLRVGALSAVSSWGFSQSLSQDREYLSIINRDSQSDFNSLERPKVRDSHTWLSSIVLLRQFKSIFMVIEIGTICLLGFLIFIFLERLWLLTFVIHNLTSQVHSIWIVFQETLNISGKLELDRVKNKITNLKNQFSTATIQFNLQHLERKSKPSWEELAQQ